jgi:hypothetical protein
MIGAHHWRMDWRMVKKFAVVLAGKSRTEFYLSAFFSGMITKLRTFISISLIAR